MTGGAILKFDAVAFDLDGTLLDTEQGIVNAVRAAVLELGYQMPSDAKLRTFIGPPMKQSMRETFCLSDEQANIATTIFRRQYLDNYLMQAKPYEGLFTLLERLRSNNTLIGVATYKRTDYAEGILHGFGIAEYCTAICGADELSLLTKADIVKNCIEELKAKPSRTLYVGDTAGDMRGAIASEASFAAVTYGFGFAPNGSIEPIGGKYPVFVANTIADLIKYLFGEDRI